MSHPKIAELYHRHGYGFLAAVDLPELIAVDRLQPCLVRCGAGRFTAPAQDVAHFVAIIEADGRDYVRDVSMMLEEAPPRPKPPAFRPMHPNGPTGHGDICHSDADPGL